MDPRTRPAALADINVTPLVDVLLVLLIIFMVVVPLAQRGLDVSLPPAANPSQDRDRDPLVLTIAATGLTLNGQPVAANSDLAGLLADLFAARRDRTLFVRADGVVPYGDVVAAMDAAKGAGADRIGIMNAR